jgi:pyrimidine deaminase RibD-like protein
MITELDVGFMRVAIEISKSCPPSMGAYSVGSIIVDKNNKIVSTGYSRETADNVHAEEVAINKAQEKGINLNGMTIYATMEPCGLRLSGKKCCAVRIIEAGITRVVYGIDEPPHFVQNCTGIEQLRKNGIVVEQILELRDMIEALNDHIK